MPLRYHPPAPIVTQGWGSGGGRLPARASRRLTPRGLDRADGAGGSCPGGFPWTLIRDRAFWDGGLTDNTPLKPVIDNLHGDEQVDQQLPADARVRKDKDWAEVMNYALVRQIRMIDMNKPAEESASDWSPETIARRIRSGYDQTRAALEETPLMA